MRHIISRISIGIRCNINIVRSGRASETRQNIYSNGCRLRYTSITNRRVGESVGAGSTRISRVVHGAICIDDHAALATLGYARDLDVCTFKVIIGQNINVHCLTWSHEGTVIEGILLRRHVYTDQLWGFIAQCILHHNGETVSAIVVRFRGVDPVTSSIHSS